MQETLSQKNQIKIMFLYVTYKVHQTVTVAFCLIVDVVCLVLGPQKD